MIEPDPVSVVVEVEEMLAGLRNSYLLGLLSSCK
jgi:hypothetical protein